ncbi:MAG: hypothetical protein HY690_04450 [Chloroflexi bacterium]|nr:hypothetical protein [Chloroflexota bacterium]
MAESDRAPLRPALLRSSALLASAPRLHVPAAPSSAPKAWGAVEEARGGAAAAPPQPHNGASHGPTAGLEPLPRLERQDSPDVIVLPLRARLSLPRLFKLEQDIARLTGLSEVALDILEGGQVVVQVPPQARARVREFLILAGELGEQADGEQ